MSPLDPVDHRRFGHIVDPSTALPTPAPSLYDALMTESRGEGGRQRVERFLSTGRVADSLLEGDSHTNARQELKGVRLRIRGTPAVQALWALARTKRLITPKEIPGLENARAKAIAWFTGLARHPKLELLSARPIVEPAFSLQQVRRLEDSERLTYAEQLAVTLQGAASFRIVRGTATGRWFVPRRAVDAIGNEAGRLLSTVGAVSHLQVARALKRLFFRYRSPGRRENRTVKMTHGAVWLFHVLSQNDTNGGPCWWSSNRWVARYTVDLTPHQYRVRDALRKGPIHIKQLAAKLRARQATLRALIQFYPFVQVHSGVVRLIADPTPFPVQTAVLDGGAPRHQWRPFADARIFARRLQLKSSLDWHHFCTGQRPQLGARPPDIPSNVATFYKGSGWEGWGDFLGSGARNRKRSGYRVLPWRNFEQARAFARGLSVPSAAAWKRFAAGKEPAIGFCPHDVPANPQLVYRFTGWSGWRNFLGTEAPSLTDPNGPRNHQLSSEINPMHSNVLPLPSLDTSKVQNIRETLASIIGELKDSLSLTEPSIAAKEHSAAVIAETRRSRLDDQTKALLADREATLRSELETERELTKIQRWQLSLAQGAYDALVKFDTPPPLHFRLEEKGRATSVKARPGSGLQNSIRDVVISEIGNFPGQFTMRSLFEHLNKTSSLPLGHRLRKDSKSLATYLRHLTELGFLTAVRQTHDTGRGEKPTLYSRTDKPYPRTVAARNRP